ncbi:MAG: hemolysin family protein [Candidatus Polarisedimenticolia bacterium]
MEAHIPVYLVLAMLLVLGNAFFVAAEFAMVKVRASRIEEMASTGLPGSALAREVASRLDEYLSACQLGITLVSLGLGWIGEEAFAGLLLPLLSGLGGAAVPAAHTVASVGAFVIITALHIVLGELVPKSLAIRRPGRIARISAMPLVVFNRVFYPALWILNGSANGVLRLLGLRQSEEATISEDELRILFRESIRKGVITPSEAEIMDRATRFADRSARDVMVPIERVVTWDMARSVEENLARARVARHTRYPVYDPAKNDLVAVINVKALALLTDEDLTRMRDSNLLKPLIRVPSDRRIDTVLKELRRQRQHMAVVVDKTDRPIGILTMEDILEEIFGEIQDEFESAPVVEPKTP